MGHSLREFNFTFLHGVRVRSGTNYLGKLMGCNAHVQLVPPHKTIGEFPLLRAMGSWEKAFSDFSTKYFGNKALYQFQSFLPHLGTAWLSYLIENFSLQPGHVFLKDPSVQSIGSFFDMFPNAKLILLVRDGRDNVASSMKAGLAIRSKDSFLGRSRRRLSHVLLRDFIGAARDWSSSIGSILSFDETFRNTARASQYMIVRYEDVYRHPAEMADRIFTFMGVPFDSATLESVAKADVVGSSFYGPAGQENARKPNWIATPRTSSFQPVGRWNQWNALQKGLFKRIAGKQLILMGYERDLNWE
jgi:hypothetical protein